MVSPEKAQEMVATGEGNAGSGGEKREARTTLMAWLGAASPRFIDAEAAAARASGAADVAIGNNIGNQRRHIWIGRGRRGQREVGETTTKEGATAAAKGAAGGFWVPRLEGSDSYCYVRRRNCYYGSLEGSDGGSQVLAVMVAAVEVEEATVVMEQRVVDGVDQRSRLEAMDVDSKEEQQRCGRQLLSMPTVRIGGTMATTMISGCKINNSGERRQWQQQRWLWLRGLKVADEGDESSGKKRKKMRVVAGVRRDIAVEAGENDNGPRSAVED
ncbi:hypothetical protein B296_00037584 [Ensete ventricosum]|uniref:Uncharacterized protein n=1 Tax=Ensete ventricosum TaxID=4639 RepID=A0A426YA29_ENSVE|nr:hypothetical protein B296_00037584 [Ensete ventricosum]